MCPAPYEHGMRTIQKSPAKNNDEKNTLFCIKIKFQEVKNKRTEVQIAVFSFVIKGFWFMHYMLFSLHSGFLFLLSACYKKTRYFTCVIMKIHNIRIVWKQNKDIQGSLFCGLLNQVTQTRLVHFSGLYDGKGFMYSLIIGEKIKTC